MLERLKVLEDNLKVLLDFKDRFTFEDILDNKSQEWALRYGFIETIQIMIDIACHLVSKYNLGNPSTYSECIALLEEHGYIDKNLTARLMGMVGLRNILIHEYLVVDVRKLYNLLDSIGDFKEFAYKIKDLM